MSPFAHSKGNATKRTLDGTLFVQHRTQHLNPEVEHREGKEDADTETYTPDGVEVVLTRSREDDEKDGDGEGSAELIGKPQNRKTNMQKIGNCTLSTKLVTMMNTAGFSKYIIWQRVSWQEPHQVLGWQSSSHWQPH